MDCLWLHAERHLHPFTLDIYMYIYTYIICTRPSDCFMTLDINKKHMASDRPLHLYARYWALRTRAEFEKKVKTSKFESAIWTQLSENFYTRVIKPQIGMTIGYKSYIRHPCSQILADYIELSGFHFYRKICHDFGKQCVRSTYYIHASQTL